MTLIPWRSTPAALWSVATITVSYKEYISHEPGYEQIIINQQLCFINVQDTSTALANMYHHT